MEEQQVDEGCSVDYIGVPANQHFVEGHILLQVDLGERVQVIPLKQASVDAVSQSATHLLHECETMVQYIQHESARRVSFDGQMKPLLPHILIRLHKQTQLLQRPELLQTHGQGSLSRPTSRSLVFSGMGGDEATVVLMCLQLLLLEDVLYLLIGATYKLWKLVLAEDHLDVLVVAATGFAWLGAEVPVCRELLVVIVVEAVENMGTCHLRLLRPEGLHGLVVEWFGTECLLLVRSLALPFQVIVLIDYLLVDIPIGPYLVDDYLDGVAFALHAWACGLEGGVLEVPDPDAGDAIIPCPLVFHQYNQANAMPSNQCVLSSVNSSLKNTS